MLEKVLDAFHRTLDRTLEELNRTEIPDRVNIVRHRVASRVDRLQPLTGRSRAIVAAGAAAAVLGLGTLAANAAVTDEPSTDVAAAPEVTEAPVDERAAEAERTDRGERSEPAREAEQKAEAPQESPEPSPTETEEAEPEPEPEPEPAETEQAEEASAEETPDWVHPMPGASTTSCYGQRWGALHAGVDLAAPAGTPIKAAGAGTVTDAGWVFSGYGISVVIDHHNGVFTHYAHMSDTAVSPGDSVSPGQTIGFEGSTGDSTGPHLHFEVHNGMWNQIEPTSWMRDRGVTIGGC
ncbi:MAG TPA: peptidoglycan DD-metalloendopeptidase family protein [Natronosporangium sp.]